MDLQVRGEEKAWPLRPTLVVLALALAGIGLLSCPSPIDDALLTVVEDEIAPNITITEPAANSFYKTRITVAGVLEDSAKEAGDHLGSPGTLEVRIPNSPALNRIMSFAADGSYSVSPADSSFAYDPATGSFGLEIPAVALNGPQLVIFVLTDRNGNHTELTISLFDDPTGPYIDLTNPASYSTYGLIVNVSGNVTNATNDPSTSDVERISWELPGLTPLSGELFLGPGSVHSNGDGTFTNGTFTFDSADGSFSDQVSTFGRSGTLTFVFRAVDFGGDESEVVRQMVDANIAPEVGNLAYPPDYSSAVTGTITVSGTVTEPADLAYFAYTVSDGTPPVAGANITGVDTMTGAFSLAFDVAANNLAGTLTVTILAEDSGGRDSQKSFSIYDDPTPPTIIGGTLAGDNSHIEVSFDDAVYSTGSGSGALVAADLSVGFQANGSGASLSGYTVSRTDGSPLQGGEQTVRVNLSYVGSPSGVETVEVRPAASSVYDDVGNVALTSTTTGAKLLNDQLAAGVLYVSSPTPNGSYKAGSLVDLTVRFSEAVYVGGTPALLLETGATDCQAVYQTGHGTSTLSFAYTVQSGDTSADLNYVGVGSLSGTIRDGADNPADLRLPALGAPESLAGAKAIVIDTTAPAAPGVTIEDGGDGFVNISENAGGVDLTIAGEAGTSYLISPVNAIVSGGNGGTLTGGSVTRTFTVVTDGAISLSVTLTDPAGNTGSAGTDMSTADLIPPSPPSVAIADGGDGYIDSTENTAGVDVTITGAAGCSYTITPTNATVSGGNGGVLTTGSDTRSFAAGANGSVTLAVTLTDPAGNTGASSADSSFAYITPPGAPAVVILDGDGWIGISENTAGVDFTITGLAGCSYSITPTNASISGGLTGTLTTGSTTRKLSALASGTVSVSVELQDPVGGTSPAGSDSSAADLSAPSAPSVVIADGGDGWISLSENGSGVGFTITGEAGTSYLISLTNATLSGSTTGTLTGAVANRSFTANGSGTVTVSVTLADAAGNTSSSGSDSSTADLSAPSAPTVAIDDGDGEIAQGESVDLVITGEADADYDLSLTNCSVAEGISGTLSGGGSVTLTLSASGNGLVEVQATLTDASGNEGDPGSDTSTGTGF